MDESYKYWLVAFQQMIGTKKYSQVALVEKIKERAPGVRISKGHLNAVYKERKGRDDRKIKASLDLQGAISSVYGLSYLDFLKYGQQIVNRDFLEVKPETKPGQDEIKSEITSSYAELSTDDFRNSSITEIDQMVDEYTSKVQDDFSRYAKNITSQMKAIVRSRHHIDKERVQLLSILEASSDAIKVNRATDKVILYENQAYRRMIGRSLLGVTCPGLCGEDKERCYVDEVKVKGRSVYQVREWSGRYFEIVANPIFKNGLLHSVVSIIRDITAHYNKGLSSSKSNARLQTLLDYTNDTINFFDENKQMVGATAHHNMTGVERPKDLYSFILYAGKLFEGVTEAYELLLKLYRDHNDVEFKVIQKHTREEWEIKAQSIFDSEQFIGIMIISRELL